ncbi:Regulator of Microtubule Dynamic [Blomia tropicalis]|nr:Regulator of Microtubule Dynamic [Blomia tropicalis]
MIGKYIISFGFGLLTAYVLHHVYEKRRRKQCPLTDKKTMSVAEELNHVYQLVASIQEQLDEIKEKLNQPTVVSAMSDDENVIEDIIDTKQCVKHWTARNSEEIFYDTEDSIDIDYIPNGNNMTNCDIISSNKLTSTTSNSTINKQLYEQIDDKLDENYCDKAEIFNQLSKHKVLFSNDPNYWWRMAKTSHLFAKSAQYNSEDQQTARINLLKESFKYAERALQLDEQNGDCHKWYAITIGSLNECVSTKEKIANGAKFKKHLDIAMSLKSNDPTLYHLAGRFCVEVLAISWIERKIANSFLGTLPNVSQQEALDYFLMAHSIRPNWKENILYIVQTMISMKNRNEAKRYLEQALSLPITSIEENAIQQRLLQIKI